MKSPEEIYSIVEDFTEGLNLTYTQQQLLVRLFTLLHSLPDGDTRIELASTIFQYITNLYDDKKYLNRTTNNQPTTNNQEDRMTTEEVNLLLARLGLHQVLHQSNMDNNNKAATDLHRYYGYLFRSRGRLYDQLTKQLYSIQDIETLIRSRK